jgi:hypothetical protein
MRRTGPHRVSLDLQVFFSLGVYRGDISLFVRGISKDAFGSVIPTGHRAFDRIADDCVVGRRNYGSEALQHFKPASRDENLLRSAQ